MTIDEAIKDLEYGTKQLEMEIESGLWINGSESELLCKEGIALNKQHIEWLTELKEAKRLLRLAVDDMTREADCGICLHDNDNKCPIEVAACKFKWRYADEAEKLLKEG